MGNNKKKWKSLAGNVKLQNEDPHIECLRAFMRISHLLSKYLDSKLDVFGLNRTQRRIIIFVLLRNKPMTPTELSKSSFLTIDTINKSIDNLDKMGLTRSYRSRTDRRVRKVTLTEKGLELIEKLLPVRQEVLSQVMGGFSETEIKAFSDYLHRLFGRIEHLMK